MADTHDHAPVSKAESLMSRLNLRSPDVMASAPSGKAGSALCAGQIAAAFGVGNFRVPEVERLIGPYVTKSAAFNLMFFKHTGDDLSLQEIEAAALLIVASLALEKGWKPEEKGVMNRLRVVVIDDVCNPAKYIAKSDRAWARLMGLNHNMLWTRTWSSRYAEVRRCLQALDIAAEAHIELKV